ncbi:MAG TPA: acyloxyacyl hydrolase [Pedobacter sp.]
MLFILLQSTWCFVAVAQETSNSLEIGLQRSLQPFTAERALSGATFGAMLTCHMITPGAEGSWPKKLNVSSLDLQLNYNNMRDLKIMGERESPSLGSSYAIMAGFHVSIAKFKGTALYFAPAFGIGYLSETYFTNGNPLIGSHLNLSSKAVLNVVTRVSPRTSVSVEIGILHTSNAGFRIPNSGINSFNVGLGIVRNFQPPSVVKDSVYWGRRAYRRHSFDLGVGIGRRGLFKSKESFYRNTVYAGYNYQLNSVLGLSTGFDAVYYRSLFDPLDFDRTYQSYSTSYDRWRTGIGVGPDLWLGKLAVNAKYGYYLHFNSYDKNINTYWTAGFKYSVLKWAALQAKAYMHKTEADFTSFGLLFTL